MPKFSASLLASSTLMSEVNLKGIIKLLTFSDPIASDAMTAVRAESMPPEEPINTPGNLFLFI